MPADPVPSPPPAPTSAPPDAPRPTPARAHRRTWISVGAALLLAVGGYLSGVTLYKSGYLPRPATSTPEQMRAEMRARADRPAGSNLAEIYQHNILTFVILCLGIGTAGILTGVQMFWLGFSVGLKVTELLSAGLDGRLVFWFLFPHGVPEIAAFVLAGSVGLHGMYVFVRYLRGGTLVLATEARPLLLRAGVGLALLLLSGLVEVFVTPALGRRYL